MDLLKINVNDFTEKKNGLTYLSWAHAWAKVLEIDPQATWEWVDSREFPDQTLMVKTAVKIKDHEKSCWLPVMDHRNKPIPSPNAFAINTAIMRCMTKAISMHGLGLYIYAGEDLPMSEEQQGSKPEKIGGLYQPELDDIAAYMVECHQSGKDLDAINAWYADGTFSQDAGDKQEEQKYVWGALKEYSKLRSAIRANKPEGY
jgi:hypothetical protein